MLHMTVSTFSIAWNADEQFCIVCLILEGMRLMDCGEAGEDALMITYTVSLTLSMFSVSAIAIFRIWKITVFTARSFSFLYKSLCDKYSDKGG